MAKKIEEVEDKNKIGLIDVSEDKFRVSIRKTNEALNKLEPALKDIERVFSKSDAQLRLFLADAIIGIVLGASQLGPIVSSGLLNKFKAVTMPYIVFKQDNKGLKAEYVG